MHDRPHIHCGGRRHSHDRQIDYVFENCRQDQYEFGSIFKEVAPYLQDADLTIGNLEIPLAGMENRYSRKNSRTRFSMFNCPDELAAALRQAGIQVLTTANNHCLDRGREGLLRTLKVLDNNDLQHTGTFASNPGASKYLITEVKGWRVGILVYSKSTNKIPLPQGKEWMVNRIDPNDDSDIVQTFLHMKKQVDLTIVCLFFGTEYRNEPPAPQQRLVRNLLGKGCPSDPWLAPSCLAESHTDIKRQTAIYSLGNFVSTCLQHIPRTKLGVILHLNPFAVVIILY